MSRFTESTAEDMDVGIDMSPLIDCVFILLIFFIVTTVFVEETGVEVDKPQAATASQLEKNSILIAITDKGEVRYAHRNIGIEGVRQVVTRGQQEERGIPVIIQADSASPSGTLIRVIDEAKLAGAEKVYSSTVANKS